MAGVVLKNKPLVEAIFELHWELEKREGGIQADPHMHLLVGRMYDRLLDEYPFHEPLPLASVPDMMAPYMVRHRFRRAKSEWPLVQVGPGVVTLNNTDGYTWESFKRRCARLVDVLFDVYPAPETLAVNFLQLRYIDAVDFGFERDSVFDFLGDKLKLQLGLLPSLFEDTGVDDAPVHLDLRFAFRSTRPEGEMNLRFARGERKGREALLWETTLVTRGEHTPTTTAGIGQWLGEAHELTDDWFFKLIEGDLMERFEPCTLHE